MHLFTETSLLLIWYMFCGDPHLSPFSQVYGLCSCDTGRAVTCWRSGANATEYRTSNCSVWWEVC